MPRRVSIKPNLTVAELEAKYRKSRDAVERTQWQVVWLLAQGKTTAEVVGATGYSIEWVRRIARRYNRGGTLEDRRHNNRGGVKSLLSQDQQLELWEALQGQAPDKGLWNGRKVAEWIAHKAGCSVYPQRGWEYLKKLGFTLHSPVLSIQKGILRSKRGLKKLCQRAEEIKKEYLNDVVEVWGFDEHRLGLKPILRRVWGLRSKGIVVSVHHRYQWLYLYAFVNPESGQSHWLILPRVDVEVFNLALSDFAQSIEAGKGRQVILVMDKVGWHVSKEVVVPNGVHPVNAAVIFTRATASRVVVATNK